MGRVSKEVSGQVISFIGLLLAAVSCGVPMWRVTSYVGANIVTGQIVWDGLWMNCVMQSTGQMQCKLNESLMRLSQDLQAARALVVICLVCGFIGFTITFIGAKCTSCLKKDASNATVVIIGGCLIILAAILILVPVCWSAAISISDFQSVLTIETQKREIGGSIYIGWASAAFLLIGGIVLTTSCPPNNPVIPGYGAPMYPYGPANTALYAPVYAPPGSQPYTGTYSGTYAPAKPYAAPTTYSPRHSNSSFIMVSMGRQMLGFILAIVGFLGTILTCSLPMWKVTAFIGANIVTAQIIWEGLWMNCVIQSTGQMQCKIYDSMLAMPQDIQAARALVVVAIIVSGLGIILGVIGGKCTNFVEEPRAKVRVAIASGVVFICAGVLILVPVCWSANTIIMDFYNPLLTNAQRRELGAALYIGWGTAALLILGGALLCSSCPPKNDIPEYPIKYTGTRSVARSAATSRAYV
ncbi:hypothetical protein CRENBAI_003536 [Crenichthys baileyi]|uniref:Claudin n=1 Tax=Crenichthys baileyi TaxID=28760 RepID=A0AAV9QUI1_9TELE